MSSVVQEMKTHRRQIGPSTVLFCRIVGRKETGKEHTSVQRGKQYQPPRNGAPASQARVSVRIRGSAQYKSRTARKFPTTRHGRERRSQRQHTHTARAE